ncbi:MAG: tRNA (adenosine(37)-N6)-threonylcarbamoyltransferase complex dimerization subunit type 1 TsaB [Flavobacteriaceae bacterium]
MAKILCLETATTNCSVALSENGKVLAFREDNNKGYSHAERLHLFIEEVLQESKITFQELDAIAVSKGPGSYTGLRIGVSSAKGLCYSLGIPLISIPTLQLLALQINQPTQFIIPLLDARKNGGICLDVFDAEMNEIRQTKAEILEETSFSEYLQKGIVSFIGSGAEKWKGLCTSPQAVFVENAYPSALQMVSLADEKYKKSDIEDVAYFEPYYLKDFLIKAPRKA